MAPEGDIRKVNPVTVPDHDIMTAGFPCQPFSRMGNKRGTNEERGRVMDYAVDILRVKRPRAFILENVRGLLTSNGGEDFKRLESMIKEAGYSFQHQLLRCEDFGIPQTRHRVFMIGFRDGKPPGFQYPKPLGNTPTLSEYLGIEVVKQFSNTVRCSGRKSGVDNAKNWSAYRMKDGSVIEYTLDQVAKVQGFPDDFEWGGVPDSQRWKMLGNTIPTCLSRVILDAVAKHLNNNPEMPAIPLPPAQHPPPARKLIEDRLADCSKRSAEKKRAREQKEREEEGDGSEGEDEELETPVDVKAFETPEKEDFQVEPPLKKPRETPPATLDQIIEQPAPPPQQVRVPQVSATAMMHLTVKSGSEFTFSLPESIKEQSLVIKIVH